MRNRRTGWRIASARGMAALMAVITVFHVAPAVGSPGDIFDNPAPVLASEPGKAAAVADGDTTVASQTGALNYSYPIKVPPGRSGMQPHLSLAYSSQAPLFGSIASGWSLSIPEIREDVSAGRMRTHYPPLEAMQSDPKLDDRFVSSLAGGRPLILVSELGDPAAYQYRAQGDNSYSRYERMKTPASGFWWRVYGTDGSIRYFGGIDQTLGCMNVGEGFSPLTREVDAFGSEVLYSYESVIAGECRIKNIKYGQNTAAGVGTFAQVDFTYSPDQVICGGLVSGLQRDYRTGKLIVTGASRLTTITSTAFAPNGSPASALHSRTVALGYDVTAESCTLQHAPVKLLTTITESASGVDSPLVTLPPKTFTYNPRTTTWVPPPSGVGLPWNVAAQGIPGEDAFRRHSLAWGYRRTDARTPSVEAMLVDLDGDGLLDRLWNTSLVSGHTTNCTAAWAKNMGVNPANGLLVFSARGSITLPRLKWHGPGLGWNPVAGGTEAGIADNLEGCSLSGQSTNYRNSQNPPVNATCHDLSTCNAPTNPLDPDLYCNVNAPNKGTACPPNGGLGQSMLTYLAYRWMDVTGDGLVDLVTAVHGSSNNYDIERGNLKVGDSGSPSNFTLGEPTMFGIPGLDGWPPCPGPALIDRCANTGPIPNMYQQNCDQTGLCVPDWPIISTAVNNAPKVGCGKVMAKPGPGGGGGSGGGPTRFPYERCQGLYPWIIYPGLGAGVFATVPTIKYQPVPLESDNGDSSFGGPAITATNHAIQDFDGDGSLDALVHADPTIVGGAPDLWQVWFGDRTGQIGGRMFTFPTRTAQTGQLGGVGLQGAPVTDSSVGLIDFNSDGIPDHWRLDGANNVNIALNKGLNLDLTTLNNGFINTPKVLLGTVAVGVKPGADATFAGTAPPTPGFIREGVSTSKNRPVDVDGDGRVDVVRWNGGSPLVFWNYGGQLSDTGISYPGNVSYPSNKSGVERRVAASQTGPGSEEMFWELEGDLMDLDGDGRSEPVWFPDLGQSTFWRANPQALQPPRLMATINNGRGANTAVTYASMHEAAVVEQNADLVVDLDGVPPLDPRPKASPTTQWVVNSMSTSDLFTPGAAVTSYVYKYPVHGKDDEGRYGFRGFEQVTTTSPSGSRTVQRYSYAPDWSGRLAVTVVMPKLGSGEGNSDARSIDRTTWEERQLFGGAIKTYHATVSEHFTCKNGQGDPTDPYASPPPSPCNATTAGGYTRTTQTLNTLASTTSGNLTPLLWQETDSLLQAGTSTADGDRTTKTTFALNADVAVYRLRAIALLNQVRVAGAFTKYGRTATTWDATYRVPVMDEVWFDNVDANRAITNRTFDMATGNLTQETDPRNNVITFEYDGRKQFVSAENQVWTHNYEFEYEPGTGTKLLTRGPQWAFCKLAMPQPTCLQGLARDENKIRVDGLGRTIERFASVNPDPTLDYFELRKVEMNTYVDTPPGGTLPTYVTHQAAIKETSPNVIVYAQDKTELDGHGRPIKKTVFANGAAVADQITTFHYNPEGTLKDVTVPDPSQNTTATVLYDYTFDSLGRAKTIRRPDNTTLASRSGVDMSYDGVVTTAKEEVGAQGGLVAITKTTNDSFGRLLKVEEQKDTTATPWAVTLYAYDANNNVSQITDPESKVTTLSHDFASRRTGISRINGATTKTWTYGYDKTGNMNLEMTPCTGTNCGALAYTTTTAYDAFNHPTSKLIAHRGMSQPDLTLFGAEQESMTWDLNSNGHGQLVQWRTFGGGTEALLQWRTHDPQGRSTMNWQSFNRAGYSQVRAIQHAYHLSGAAASTSYGDFVNNGTWQTVSKTDLDARGLPSTISISVDNGGTFPTTTAVTQTRNVAGLVTKRLDAMPAGAAVESNWLYDKLGRVANQTVQKVAVNGTTTAVAQQALQYNGNDDPKRLDQFLGTASKTFTYSYDLRHQLLGVTTAAPFGTFFGATYVYGSAGRFTKAKETRTQSGITVTDLQTRDVNYVYSGADAEQVTALTNVSGGARFATYTYDDSGNMLTRCFGATFSPTCTGELLEFLYDGKDQLRRTTRKFNNAITGSEEYWYDSDGNRTHLRKLNGSGVTQELVWYLDEAEHHLNVSSLETRAFAHVSVGTPVARIDRAGDFAAPIEYQFHGLASNTLAAVAQSNGTINASFSYAPFGEVLDGTGTTADVAAHKRRFNDKVQDDLSTVSPLTYYGARYYDRSLIGWTQADPVARFAPDASWIQPRKAALYSFSVSNPNRYVDPDGRYPGEMPPPSEGFELAKQIMGPIIEVSRQISSEGPHGTFAGGALVLAGGLVAGVTIALLTPSPLPGLVTPYIPGPAPNLDLPDAQNGAKGGTGAADTVGSGGSGGTPALPGTPYAPDTVEERQRKTRQDEGANPNPRLPVPDRPATGRPKKDEKPRHDPGTRSDDGNERPSPGRGGRKSGAGAAPAAGGGGGGGGGQATGGGTSGANKKARSSVAPFGCGGECIRSF